MYKTKTLAISICVLLTSVSQAEMTHSSMDSKPGCCEKNNVNMMNMSPEQHVQMMKDHMKKMDPMMMQALGPKDKNYDLRFMDVMIMHHEGGIKMAKDALKNAIHPELKDMAQKIIDSQQKEIDQMQQWKKDWYGK